MANKNILILEERGCPFFNIDNCLTYSDLKNYRLFTQLLVEDVMYYFEFCTHDYKSKQDFEKGKTGVITYVSVSYKIKHKGTYGLVEKSKYIFPTKVAILQYFKENFNINFDYIRIVKHKKWKEFK